MVRFIQRIIYIVLAVCFLPLFNLQAAEQASPVELTIQKRTTEYGKPLKIEIKALTSINVNIPTLLKPLENNFSHSITSRIENKIFTLYKIKLFPLREGITLIPGLFYENYKTQPGSVTVTAPLSGGNQPISVKLNKVNLTPWVREQTRILATIVTTDKNILLRNKDITQNGSDSYLIPHTTKKIKLNGNIFYEHKIGWNLFFLYNQNINMNLPVIEYVKDGVPRYKFHFQKIKINIKKLPIYIRPTIPVGKISLSAEYLELPRTLLQPNMTSIIQYSLIGENIPAKWLPSLSQKYITTQNTGIEFAHIKTKLNTKNINKNIRGEKISDIAFTPLSNGMLPIKDIHFQYFDPETGLLNSITYQHNKILVLHWFLQIVFSIILFLILYILASKTIYCSIRWFKKQKYHFLCRAKISSAETFMEIRRALEYFSIAEKWPVNISLNQWLHRVENKYKVPNSLNEICNKLNNNLYAADYHVEKHEVETMKATLLNSLKMFKH